MSVDADSTFSHDVLSTVQAGRRLGADQLRAVASTTDILALGALADGARRRHRGTDVTFVRVHVLDVAHADAWTAVPPTAHEVRLVGWSTLEALATAVGHARALAGDRVLRGFSQADVWSAGGPSAMRLMAEAGLDELAWVETGPEAAAALHAARAAGLAARVVGVHRPPVDRAEWLVGVQALMETAGGLDVVAPLPRLADSTVPTTGFDDVRTIALARLAFDGVVSVQVDWKKDGPKLAQVALTVGADDLDGVSPDDDLSKGPRRAPLEEVRRNAAAAGFVAVERDGRYRRLAG